MSPAPDKKDGSHSRSRQRSNTGTFAPFTWRRGRAETTATTQTPQTNLQQPPSVDALLAALTPPAVPSLANARALATALAAAPSATSSIRPSVVSPVLSALCASDAPYALQATGFDILAAYLDSTRAVPLATADRYGFLGLIVGSPADVWVAELWEPRFRAISSLSAAGRDIVGIEKPFVRALGAWIEAAFAELLTRDNSGAEWAERERTVTTLCDFLTRTVSRAENVSRFGEPEVTGLLSFFAGLINRAMVVADNISAPSDPQNVTTTPSRTSSLHRRHHSSTSSPLGASAPSTPPRRPLDIAVTIYLDHLAAQLGYLSSDHLKTILPVLFRCLAFYSTSLPRLSLSASDQFGSASPLERRIIEMLDPLLNGTYTTTCFIILKRHLLPQPLEEVDIRTSSQTSTGACRALRIYIRRALCSRLARAYIARMSTDTITPSGAPGNIDLEHELMEFAWAKDEVTRGDLGKVGRILRRAADNWVALPHELPEGHSTRQREDVLVEIAGVLKDVFQEYDERGETEDTDDEEKNVIGEILQTLTGYVRPLKQADGAPLIIPLNRPSEAPTEFLRILSSLLARDHATTPSNPLLTTILLSVADHIVDSDSAKLIEVMLQRGDLSPVTLDWLSSWALILGNETLYNSSRPLTRSAVLEALQNVFTFVKDIAAHRHPLIELAFRNWKRQAGMSGGFIGADIIWDIIAEEFYLRATEIQEQEADSENQESCKFLDCTLVFLTGLAESEDLADVMSATMVAPSASAPVSATATSATVSPALSRIQSETFVPQRGETTMPSLTSLLSSFASGTSTRSHTHTPPVVPDEVQAANVLLASAPEPPLASNAVGAVVTLLHIFGQLSFTPSALSERNRGLSVRIFQILINLLTSAKSSRARLTVLQFLFRLRVDRDHRLYSVHERYDRLGHISALATLIGRVEVPHNVLGAVPPEEGSSGAAAHAESRARAPERNGRRSSRGREQHGPSRSASSRSRSRVPVRNRPPAPPLADVVINQINQRPIWHIPETLPFSVPDSDTPSDGLISYDPDGPGTRVVLPVSSLLLAIIGILQTEKDWEILSYVLCHLPTLLANKHFFCGPRSKGAISTLLSTLCNSISKGEFAVSVTNWPPGLKTRDAQALAYHTLSVLISYKTCFEPSLQHVLVEVLITGLSGQQSAIKCCLHALTLAAFELPDSMRRFLTNILTKLSQIMTNATIAVHIIDFLAMVGSLPMLYTNFIEDHYKMVFGVALQYLRLHNQPERSSDSSWALSQHVRVMSFYILYSWFLAVKLPDRPRHVKYIIRQLLLANEGQAEIDEPTEVCFDWLARYTYGSADPRPTKSMLSDVIFNPSVEQKAPESIGEKTWILGNAVVTIRALAKLGWVEVNARRASGLTRIVARTENVPLVGPGEVDPDMVSVPAILTMDRGVSPDEDPLYQDILSTLFPQTSEDETEGTETPDPVTGFVWQGTAPSQRRKDVAVDPSYFALQLSQYPDDFSRQRSRVVDAATLPALFRTLDRIPVIDTHKVGILYVAPGQTHEDDILANTHGSPAYTRFLEGLGRLINLRGQVDVYAGGLDPDEDGEYAYAWWDDIGQILYHTATLMPQHAGDIHCNNKKKHIGNDCVRIVWNDSGLPYRFDTLSTQFQFVNFIIEPHSVGAISAFSDNMHENEYFRVTIQRAPGMTEFTPIGNFKLISAKNLPLLMRQLSLLGDWFASVFQHTEKDTAQLEMPTNWRARLQAIKRFRSQLPPPGATPEQAEGILGQEPQRDFTSAF